MSSDRVRRALGGVVLRRPDVAWRQFFRQERSRLATVLGDLAEDLQHYGSTAVPGLAAKPIIDMMGRIGTLAEADDFRGALERQGYALLDVGFERRRFFRREASDSLPAFHLHLAVCANWPIKNELLFRDWLLEHPDGAAAYAALKERLASLYRDDMPGYTEEKTAFIREAVNAARAERGLPPETDWIE